MKHLPFSLFFLSFCHAATTYTDPHFLPEDFAVYTQGKTVLNWQISPQYEKRILPTFNFYSGENGGYLAIYTRDAQAGVYSVGSDIYVMGQIRVEGHYEGRIFIPKGFEAGDDITQDPELLKICENYFPNMANRMWVGGDTGGWFGI